MNIDDYKTELQSLLNAELAERAAEALLRYELEEVLKARAIAEELQSRFVGRRPELYCVHVLGPDTIIAQPDLRTAVQRAHQWNLGFAHMMSQLAEERREFYPICYCNVEIYEGTPEEHAAQLAEHGGAPEELA